MILKYCENLLKSHSCCEELKELEFGMIGGQDGTVMWRRERHPHILILLKNFLSLIFLPPFLPPNDRLRKADL